MARRLPAGWVHLARDPRWRAFAKRYAGDMERFAREVTRLDLSEQQEALFIEVQAPRSRVSVASGHGCFSRGTKVMRADGTSVCVEDVQPGDSLMGADGRQARTVEQLARGTQAMYRITYADGTGHTVNRSHILCLTNGRKEYAVSLAAWLSWSEKRKAQFKAYRLLSSATETEPAEYLQLPIASVKYVGRFRYYGFSLAGGDGRFLGEDGTVLHNTGKTTSIATIVLWHMLCFVNSVTLLTANDMDQLKATLWKEVGLAVERIRIGPHGWICDHIDLMADGTMRVRGYEDTWFVESKTANAKTANKMAGRHGRFFMVIGDEASTLPDEVCTTLNGALTEEDNRFLLTSQPTRNAGFFYDTHHRLSIRSGGPWVPLVFSSFDSPFVSDVALEEMWNTYDEDQRRVRLLGQFPQDSSKHYLSLKDAQGMYERGRIIQDNEPYGWLVLGDIASGEGLRDKAAVVLARVIGWGDKGEMPRRVEVVSIPIHTSKIRANVLASHIADHGADLPSPTDVIDAGGLGINVCQDLEDRGHVVHRVWWGQPCFKKENRMRYMNKRAQATHQASRAAKEGRLSILTGDYQSVVLDQSSRVPKAFTDKGMLKVPPKGSTEWDGLGSPDLWDAICFAFLEDVEYIPWTADGQVNEVENVKASLAALADTVFG